MEANAARAAFEKGNLKAAGSILCSLLSEVNAQEGVHIDPASADEIRNTVDNVADALGIPLSCGSVAKSGRVTSSNVPESYSLAQNYPNPFNPETQIRFELPEASHVVIKIFNTVGQEVRTLIDSHYESGYHSARWDGKDNFGNVISSGTYIYHFKSGTFTQVKKMSLIR